MWVPWLHNDQKTDVSVVVLGADIHLDFAMFSATFHLVMRGAAKLAEDAPMAVVSDALRHLQDVMDAYGPRMQTYAQWWLAQTHCNTRAYAHRLRDALYRAILSADFCVPAAPFAEVALSSHADRE